MSLTFTHQVQRNRMREIMPKMAMNACEFNAQQTPAFPIEEELDLKFVSKVSIFIIRPTSLAKLAH